MNTESLYVGLPSLISVIIAVIGLVRWISKLKSRLIVLETYHKIQKEENHKIHVRITKTQEDLKANKADSDLSIKELTKQLYMVEKNIIKEIHNTFKK